MLPLKVGAALPISAIPEHKDWLFSDARDLELQDFIDPEALIGDWHGIVERAKVALDGFEGRLGIHGPFIGLDISNGDPEVQQVVSHRHVAGIEAAAALGARQMVIHSPFTLWSKHHKLAGYGGDEKIIEAVKTVLGPALELGETHGVTMVVENCMDAEPTDRRAMVEAIGSKALALSIDTGHAHLARNMLGAPSVDMFVRDAGNLLKHVHIQDLDGYADRHWPPGEGSIEWRAVFTALAECESAPHLVLELRDHTQVPEGFDYLESLGLAL